jgi:hypothetical protein
MVGPSGFDLYTQPPPTPTPTSIPVNGGPQDIPEISSPTGSNNPLHQNPLPTGFNQQQGGTFDP